MYLKINLFKVYLFNINTVNYIETRMTNHLLKTIG